MKYRIAAALGLALTISLFAGSAHSQQPPVQATATPVNPSTSEPANNNPLYKQLDTLSIDNPKLWLFLLAACGSGAIGGLVYYLMNFKEIQEILDEEVRLRRLTGCTRNTNYVFANFMCCISKMSIGAAAAPTAILILRPESAFALLATSTVVGSAGSAVLRNVQEKMMTTLAKTKAEEAATRQQALVLNHKQSIEVGRLIEIAEKGSAKPEDWIAVKEIAEALKANCQTCHDAFTKSVQSISPRPEAVANSETTKVEKESLNGLVPVPEVVTPN
ncbi:hypothetical protein H6F95_28725 [Cyanobacteria bacterium FACHB-471]|nr:hypothetical protein [Cyanobacteria bacterium FACHB-471]